MDGMNNGSNPTSGDAPQNPTPMGDQNPNPGMQTPPAGQQMPPMGPEDNGADKPEEMPGMPASNPTPMGGQSEEMPGDDKPAA